MSFTYVVIFNFVFLLCFIIQYIVVIIHWNGRTSSLRNNFAIKPHKNKQLQISARMKLGDKSELIIEQVFLKEETHLASTYTFISQEAYLNNFTQNNKTFKNVCRSNFFPFKIISL